MRNLRTSISIAYLHHLVTVILTGHRWCENGTVQDELLHEVEQLQRKIRHAEELHYKHATKRKDSK